MDFSVVNIWAVLVASLSGFVIGSLWYSPVLFGKAWMELVGMTEEKAKSANMGKTMGLAFVFSVIISFNMSLFFGGQVGFTDGLLYGFFTGLFFVGMAFAVTYLFEQKPFKLWFINAGYQVIFFTVVGGVIGAWH